MEEERQLWGLTSPCGPTCIPAAPTAEPPPTTCCGVASCLLINANLRWPSNVETLHLNFSGLPSSALPLTGPMYFPPPLSLHKTSASSSLGAPCQLRPPEGPRRGCFPVLPQVTSESGLSEESSSPEGDVLWVGLERNQLNQPKPELWGEGRGS